MSIDNEQAGQIVAAVSTVAGLRALALFGSRSRGDAHAGSDWDFAMLGDGVNRLELTAALVTVLGTERIDVVDLDRAGGVVRFRAASDGVLLYEPERGAWRSFVLQSSRFWCDQGPIIERALAGKLASLGSPEDAAA